MVRPLRFLGKSLDTIRKFPGSARRDVGYQLDRLQRGLNPVDWWPVTQVGPGIRELRVKSAGEFRVRYLTQFKESIYVLHAFRKKTTSMLGRHLVLARQIYREVKNE